MTLLRFSDTTILRSRLAIDRNRFSASPATTLDAPATSAALTQARALWDDHVRGYAGSASTLLTDLHTVLTRAHDVDDALAAALKGAL
ncbi:hypothetical protein [Corynebacterium uterequi]|uniref:Uncharacterized protein n=1 Tax=Corynebacterium uterequi TaxID=1072256 RepID=A0A0G3HJ13_9CORY|nr:hypothetical protein [Corynebacterium uterequi]AKK11943.1 hypothetical protein CUTER_09875 [Corynebacterium uterequi]